MTSFSFSHKDILNSVLKSPQTSTTYTISTKKGIFGRKSTTLSLSGSRRCRSGSVGAILWRKNSFEIGGVKRKRKDIKRRSGSIFSSKREWQWSGQRYILKYSHKQWSATSTSSSHHTSAVFTPYASHLLSSSVKASIVFSPDVSAEDRAFLILAMIYSEDKRHTQEEEETVKAAVDIVNAAGS